MPLPAVHTCPPALTAALSPFPPHPSFLLPACARTRQPRNLPTARITRSSLSQELKLPASTAWLVPILFQLFRLLAVVPALFGTLWNLYRVLRPPDGLVAWRVDYSVCVLWVSPPRVVYFDSPFPFAR